jgi:hypothetical protein
MLRRSEGPRVSLKQRGGTPDISFVWSATSEGWRYLADLVASLREGSGGHHYLTEDGADDATIEFSFGERNMRDAARVRGIL